MKRINPSDYDFRSLRITTKMNAVSEVLWRQGISSLYINRDGNFSISQYKFGKRESPNYNPFIPHVNGRTKYYHDCINDNRKTRATMRKYWSPAMTHLSWINLGHGGHKRPYRTEPTYYAIGYDYYK